MSLRSMGFFDFVIRVFPKMGGGGPKPPEQYKRLSPNRRPPKPTCPPTLIAPHRGRPPPSLAMSFDILDVFLPSTLTTLTADVRPSYSIEDTTNDKR